MLEVLENVVETAGNVGVLEIPALEEDDETKPVALLPALELPLRAEDEADDTPAMLPLVAMLLTGRLLLTRVVLDVVPVAAPPPPARAVSSAGTIPVLEVPDPRSSVPSPAPTPIRDVVVASTRSSLLPRERLILVREPVLIAVLVGRPVKEPAIEVPELDKGRL